MRRLTSIVAVNEDGAIGSGNSLPWRVRSDLRFFRAQTEGNVVIMGRRTYHSLGDRGLPKRKNIVVTHGFGMFSSEVDCRAAGSIEEALVMAHNWRTKTQEVFVVGGASMYEQFSPYVDRYLITKIKKPVPLADTFFRESIIGCSESWRKKIILEGQADGKLDEADFTIFELVSNDPLLSARKRDLVIQAASERRRGNRLDISFVPASIAI